MSLFKHRYVLFGALALIYFLVQGAVGDEPVPEITYRYKNDPPALIRKNQPAFINIPESYKVDDVLGWVTISKGHDFHLTSSSQFIHLTQENKTQDSLTMNIVLNEKPDADRNQGFHRIKIDGRNSKYSASHSLALIISITNINDETPQLKNKPYSVTIREDSAKGATVYTKIDAEDLDANDHLLYSLVPDDGVFQINDRSGDLSHKGQLDFESKRFYKYTVVVRDDVGHNDTADIFITIDDVQDTPPSFTAPSYHGNVEEEVRMNYTVLKVKAVDGDKGKPNPIIYSIENSTCPEMFDVDQSSGAITVASDNLDRDSGLVYKQSGLCVLDVKATEREDVAQDLEPPDNTVSVRVEIRVEDINDNGPEFSNHTFHASIAENTPEGVPLTVKNGIYIKDVDQGSNSRFKVAVTSLSEYFEPTSSEFESTSEIVIRVKNSSILDFEAHENLIIELRAYGLNGKFNDTCEILLNITNVNDNRPQFSNATFESIIEEELPIGSYVTTIQAHDRDSNADGHEYGQVSYSLNGGSQWFLVNQWTGVVTTEKVLDREKRGFYQFTVIAEDGGKLRSSTELNVILQDVNDKSPVFSSTDYLTSLDEESLSLSPSLSVHATDDDEDGSENAKFEYGIISTSPPNLTKHFDVNKLNGKLTVKKKLDFESIFPSGGSGKIELNVSATDQGSNPNSNFVKVTVILQDINDNTPLCTIPLDAKKYMNESKMLHRPVINITAQDDDATPPNNLTLFELDIDSTGTFLIDQVTGHITTTAELDREKQDSYNITVTVKDRAVNFRSSTCTFQVVVKDVNDEPPQFTKVVLNKYKFRENTQTSVNLSATDADSDSDLNYSIDWDKSSGIDGTGQYMYGDHLKKFIDVNAHTGEVSPRDHWNREDVKQIQLNVLVTDRKGVGNQTASASFTIVIEDENDNPPRFEGGSYFIGTIIENAAIGTEVKLKNGTLTIKDPDEIANSRYNISLENERLGFSISPSVGQLETTCTIHVTNSSQLDYEERQNINLTIIVTEDNQTPVKGFLNINIEKVNDNRPQFMNAQFEASVMENSSKEQNVIKVEAHDADLGGCNQISYKLTDADNRFKIDNSSGFVQTTAILDREEKISYQLTVVAEDNCGLETSTQLTVTVKDANDNPPIFRSRDYQASVEENSSQLFPPLSVSATDNDERGSPNSQIEYGIVSTSPSNLSSFLNVNKLNGKLTVKKKLDFESIFPSGGSGKIELNVSATDQGSNPNSDFVTVTVILQDINDNTPFCTSPLDAKKYINESKMLHRPVINITAQDDDATPPNNLTLFELDIDSTGTFLIDQVTGHITTTAELDREKQDSYNITVTVKDRAVNFRSSTCTFQVVVKDVNDEPPQFIKVSQQCFKENTHHSVDLSATDADSDSDLSYSIDWDKSSGIDGSGQYMDGDRLKNHIVINNSTGKVSPIGDWDREKVKQIQLNVLVTDTNGENDQTASASFAISIEDENDNPPIFEDGSYFTGIIKENAAVGSEVKLKSGSLTIKDPDEIANSRYNISVEDEHWGFSVSPSVSQFTTTCTIHVTNSSLLDYEERQSINLTLIVTQKGQPNVTAFVTIEIENVNDNRPQFARESFTASMEENSPLHQSVTTLKALDHDKDEYNNVSYSLIDVDNRFNIDKSTGVVTLIKNDTDYEKRKMYTLSVVASDGWGLATVPLRVDILDVNDNTPEFKKNMYAVTVEEERNFTSLISVQADDKDGTTNNSLVSYSIIENYENKFSINENTGQINLQSPLDFETHRHDIHVTVMAQDHGLPSKNSTTTILVTLTDVNDFAPNFTERIYNASVKENEGGGSVITSVLASDGDGTAQNNETYYIIHSGGQDKFQINSSSGEITLRPGPGLDREQTQQFKLIVFAIDKGIEAKTATATVHVLVEDVNDTPPHLTEVPLPVEILENCTVNTVICSIAAEDKDSSPELEFALLWNESTVLDGKGYLVDIQKVESWFSITTNGSKGILRVNSELDREIAESFALTVTVEDVMAEEKKPQRVSAIVRIKLLDVNDNAPVIMTSSQQTRFDFNVSEATEKGTEITKLEATDADKNQQVRFTLRNSEHFTISISGKLWLSKPLDRETEPETNFTAIATDNGYPPNSSTIEVLIKVLDANDNDPKFESNNYTFSVLENSKKDTECGKIRATDADEGKNGQVSYRIKDNFSKFGINDKGTIYVKDDNLDREVETEYLLTVIAYDNPRLETPRTNSTLVTISIKDKNDNEPIFDADHYKAVVRETSEKGEKIPILPKEIHAKDADVGQNANVTYSLVTSVQGSDLFSIDNKTGEVEVKRANLRDHANTYNLTVIAQDQGSPPKNSTVGLTIEVQDENIHPPIFTSKGSIKVPVFECMQSNSIVTTAVKALDGDKNKETNGRIIYSLINDTDSTDWKFFSIDRNSGQIMLAKKLDFEKKRQMKIQVRAEDCGLPSLSSSIVVIITVLDVNDNPPKFTNEIADMEVRENTFGVRIGSLAASDNDTNSILEYSIDSGDYSEYFNITSSGEGSGDIYVIKPLDREKYATVSLTISVTDKIKSEHNEQCPPHSDKKQDKASTKVKIIVKDVDDNPPRFTLNDTVRTRGILSNSEVGTQLFDLNEYVHDNDTAGTSKHNFFIRSKIEADFPDNLGWSPKANPFPINISANGTLYTDYKFSEDAHGVFNITVTVEDSAGKDVSYVKIYVVGDSQVIHLTFYQTEENLRHLQDHVVRAIQIPGYEVIADNILPYSADEGEVDGSKSVLVVHAVDKQGNVLEGEKLLRLIDVNPRVSSNLQEKFKVLKTQVGSQVSEKVVKSEDERIKYILIAVISIISVTFAVTLALLLNTFRRFQRKIRAATLQASPMWVEHSEKFPGLENSSIKDCNPIYSRDDLVFADTDIDDISNLKDSDSIASTNSLDDNAIVSHGSMENEAFEEDEQEITINFDEPYDQVDLDGPPNAVNYLNSIVESKGQEGYKQMVNHSSKENNFAERNGIVPEEHMYSEILPIDRSQLESSDI